MAGAIRLYQLGSKFINQALGIILMLLNCLELSVKSINRPSELLILLFRPDKVILTDLATLGQRLVLFDAGADLYLKLSVPILRPMHLLYSFTGHGIPGLQLLDLITE